MITSRNASVVRPTRLEGLPPGNVDLASGPHKARCLERESVLIRKYWSYRKRPRPSGYSLVSIEHSLNRRIKGEYVRTVYGESRGVNHQPAVFRSHGRCNREVAGIRP